MENNINNENNSATEKKEDNVQFVPQNSSINPVALVSDTKSLGYILSIVSIFFSFLNHILMVLSPSQTVYVILFVLAFGCAAVALISSLITYIKKKDKDLVCFLLALASLMLSFMAIS